MQENIKTSDTNKGFSQFWLNFVKSVMSEKTKQDGEISISLDTITKAFSTSLGSELRTKTFLKSAGIMAEYLISEHLEGEDSINEEKAAQQAAKEVFRGLLEVRLQEKIDRIDEKNKRKPCCPKCGKEAKSAGKRTRNWLSSFGNLSLKRRRSICEEHGSFSFAEQELLLPQGDYTARLSELMTLLGTTVPEGTASQLIGTFLGVEVGKHGIQGELHERGIKVIDLQKAESQSCNPWYDNGFARKTERPEPSVAQAPQLAYLEIDGVLPLVREVDEERSKRPNPSEKARGGKGLRYDVGGKEVKNAILYVGDDCVEESPSRGCILDKHYVSHLGHWKPFALMLWAAMLPLRFDEAGTLVVLSDGANWIRKLAQWLPCGVFMILDLYHAKKRLWEVARSIYGDKTTETAVWAKKRCKEIENGNVQKVIDRLCRLKNIVNENAAEKIEELTTYYTNNLDRMDYPNYRERGLRISSAAIESANYHVTGSRMKLQGMRWSLQGATEMAALRADLHNGIWEDRTKQVLANA